MNIALLGYGRMGHEIEHTALQRHHNVLLTIDSPEEWLQKESLLASCDAAIEFSTPQTAVDNILRCFKAHLPVVVGTTGWYSRLDEIDTLCREQHQSLFVASNFSIGVNILFELNSRLAALMDRYPEYRPSITETHHIHKLDAPSGTAVTLADGLLSHSSRFQSWALADQAQPSQLPITAIRQGEVPGIHEVVYDSPMDTLSIRHSAKSRQGFALGAVLAAEYLVENPGRRSMKDLLA